jgi:tryptophan synthase alpha chain
MNQKTTSPHLALFITAGFPHLHSLEHQLKLIDAHNVAFVEIGMPFSDPLADGPVIQQTSAVALNNGMSIQLLFEQLRQIKSTTPRLLMGYVNPVLQYGIERFLSDAKSCGIHHVILPDLPVEVYERRYKAYFDEVGVTPCFLITPRSDDERIRKVAQLSRNGFVYLVSTNATTGGAAMDYSQMQQRYREIKILCGETPVYVGFGISDRQSFDAATSELDGGIIGTAFLKAIEAGQEQDFLEGLR